MPFFADGMPEWHFFFPAILIKRAFQPELMYPERPEFTSGPCCKKVKPKSRSWGEQKTVRCRDDKA